MSQESANTFQNEHVQVTCERKPGCLVKFQVVISPEAAKTAFAKAVKNVTKEVSLPGFRKGKAPQELIQKHYKKHIEQEWRDIQIEMAFYESIQLTKITPYDRNDMRLKVLKYDAAQNDGTHVELQFEAFPDVPTIDLENLEIPKIDTEAVTPQDVDDVISNIRLQMAEWKDADGRNAQEGDYINLEIEATDGTKLVEKNRYHLKETTFPDILKGHIIGMHTGEAKDVTPNEEEQKQWFDKPYKITLHSIQEPILPPIDDELAKKTGVTNVDELRKSIENQLNQRRTQNAIDHQRHHMREFLLQHYEFELPSKVIENMTGKAPSTSPTDAAEADLNKYLTGQARLAFLIHRFARDNTIELSDEELRFGTMRLWLNYVSQHGSDHSQEALKRIQEQAPNTLLTHKVLDHLISKAKQTEPCTGEH